MSLESMEVQGLKDLDAALKEIGAQTGQKVMVSALRLAAKPVLSEVKSSAPLDTGLLANNLMIKSQKGKGQYLTLATVKVQVKNLKSVISAEENKRLAISLIAAEFGTEKQQAKPFLRPALEKHWQQAVSIFKNILQKRINSAAKRQAKGKK